MSECKWFSCCPMRRFYEQGKLDKHWIDDYCKSNWRNCVRYKLEESGKYHPDEMLPDGSVDSKLKKTRK
ncbi:MAG: uracil-DNA glycosylase [Elusimicrobiota bacterium]|nr:uracil-DNA glycosylase [Elusimicrobiota bacterium]